MKIDNNNRAWESQMTKDHDSILNEEYRTLFNDVITMSNIMSGSYDVFFSHIQTFFAEAILEIGNAVLLFDSGKVTGAYGSLKCASELLLMILFIYAEGDKEKQKVRVEAWRKPNNNFGIMFKEAKLWKNYSDVLNQFPEYKSNIHECNNRIDKMRHKHSVHYFEKANRWEQANKWRVERFDNSKKDISFVCSHLLLTWLIIDPTLLISSTEEFHNRYPDAMSQFPTWEFLSKYFPEIEDEKFIENFPLTKDTYESINKMFRYSEEQNCLRAFGLIYDALNISKEERENFNDKQLLIYDLFKEDEIEPYYHCLIYGEYVIYTLQGKPPFTHGGSHMWTDDNEKLGIFWDVNKAHNGSSLKDSYDFKTIEFKGVKILLFKPKKELDLEGWWMKKIVKKWDNVPDGWKEMPAIHRGAIKEEYEQNSMLRIGKTFKVGKILINKIPELEIVNGVTYNWDTWKFVDQSWETKKD